MSESNSVEKWFKSLFCCMRSQVQEDESDNLHYSKMSDSSVLKQAPRFFFKRKYAPIANDELSHHLMADVHEPWVDNYKQANDEYEMDSMLQNQLVDQSQVQNQLILDIDL